jgi:hypothetical protein
MEKAADNLSMKHGVNVIGPALEGRGNPVPPDQGAQQPAGEGGFP